MFDLIVIMPKTYLAEVFDVRVMLVPPPLVKTTSGNSSSLVACCFIPNGLRKRCKNLRYLFLASRVSPKRAKNINKRKTFIHSFQCTPNTLHLSVDHVLFGVSIGSQSVWRKVHPW